MTNLPEIHDIQSSASQLGETLTAFTAHVKSMNLVQRDIDFWQETQSIARSFNDISQVMYLGLNTRRRYEQGLTDSPLNALNQFIALASALLTDETIPNDVRIYLQIFLNNAKERFAEISEMDGRKYNNDVGLGFITRQQQALKAFRETLSA